MLSPRQKRILEFIKRYAQSNNITPTMSEIGKQVGMRSSASVYEALTKLENQGLITRVPNVARGIRLT